MLVYWLDIVGTAVFAISGVLLAGKLRMDPFGVLVLGVVTAVGGGTIRDMALDNGPVFWVKDPTDLVVAMITSMLTILLVRQPRRLPKWIHWYYRQQSDAERRTTPAGAFRIRVSHNEAGTFQTFGIVNRAAHQILQAHRVNHQTNTLFLNGHIPFVHLIVKGETVLETAATTAGDIHT